MTEITDQDRHAARAWAKNWQGDQDDDTSAAARVILATVDAPEPTLTERLREQFHYPEQNDEQHGIILDAAQMEHDLAETKKECDHFFREVENVRNWKERLLNERDEARAEVDRLRADVARLTAAQKGAESNAESLDPADVKPGEAWLVECHREWRTAVKDRDDDEPWNTFTAGGLFFPEENEAITLVSRLVPAPRHHQPRRTRTVGDPSRHPQRR